MARVEPHQILFDFTLGGGLVAGAVAVAGLFGGVVAGVVAALPIRLAVSIGFLQVRTPEAMDAVVRGMLSAAVGYFGFVALFALLWRPAGFWPALGAATVVCVVVTAGVAAYFG
jgi:hypothetical protein